MLIAELFIIFRKSFSKYYLIDSLHSLFRTFTTNNKSLFAIALRA